LTASVPFQHRGRYQRCGKRTRPDEIVVTV
jgi:hypothetical protein